MRGVRLSAMVALAVLAGCVPPRPEPADDTPFVERPLSDSRLSYDGAAPFRSLKVSDGRERHAEAIEIDGGVLFYEERIFVNFSDPDLAPAHAASWLDRNYRIIENGFSFGPEDIEERSNRHGRLLYALLTKPDAHCFVFRQAATSRQPFETYSFPIMLSGHFCRPISVDSRLVQREAGMLISRLMFDGGARNRAASVPAAERSAIPPMVAASHWVAFAVAWGGDELWVGTGQLEAEGGFAPFVLRRAEGGVCRGRSDSPETWSIDCDDGRSAHGRFTQVVPGRGGGTGRDGGGKLVKLTFGP
jgi:hypothetical protein